MPARPLPDKFLVAFSLAGEQRELVRAIAEAVETQLGRGTVFFDEWFEHYLAGDDADLKLQKIYGEQCAVAVVCVSQAYGSKPWTHAEHRAIRARQMKAEASSDAGEKNSILPIRVGDGEVEGILFNAIVPDVRSRSAAQSAELILERLYVLEPRLRPVSGGAPAVAQWPETAPPLSWPLADHCSVRAAFAELLTSQTRWRYLPIRGASETGKSHITRQMLANSLAMPDIACGRFDFKGTTGVDAEVSAFVQELGVPAPPLNPRLSERLGHLLGALKQRAHPTLLIFDTYEMAGEAQDWIEKQLLPCLIRATWLRVVVVGQKLPDFTAVVGPAGVRPILQLVPPPAEDWFDYGRQHRASLTLAEVETVCRLASHKASLLAQLLGPTY
jgi:hypothetical protein